MNVLIPTETCDSSFTLSRHCTEVIVRSLTDHYSFLPNSHFDTFLSVQSEHYHEKIASLEKKFDHLTNNLPSLQKRAVLRAKDSKMSSWLNVLPIAKHHFDLSDREFRDALSIRYRKPLLSLPINCDGCGASFDLSHALSCRRGGLVIQRHNEVRDAFGDLANLAWGQVVKEPIVSTPALIADLAVRGVWTRQTEALFDIRVIDTDAQSYRHQTPPQVLTTAEREKKNKYSAACEERRALFTRLCISVDGLLGRETTRFLQRLAERLSLMWQRSYSTTISWIRTRLTFAVIRATILCLRGSHTKWQSIDIVDGSPLDYIMY